MKRIVIAAISLAFVALACNPQDQDKVQRDASNLAKSAGQAVSNANLGERVHLTLSWRKGLDISGLKTDAQGGTVTLTGSMPNEDQHKTVVDLVTNIEGVDKIVDNIKTQP